MKQASKILDAATWLHYGIWYAWAGGCEGVLFGGREKCKFNSSFLPLVRGEHGDEHGVGQAALALALALPGVVVVLSIKCTVI